MAAASPGQAGREPRRDTDAAELPLGLGEARLPWLEDADEEAAGDRRGLLVAAILAALVVLALLGGGIWYALHRARAAPVAAGGIIAAPTTPYKVRPADAGGIVADDTEALSYTVAEGGKRPAPRLASAPDASPSGTAEAGVGVQVGAFASAAEAEAAWPPLAERYPLLAPLRHRVSEESADLGSVFGLQAMTADAAAAQALCGELRAGGLNCRVRQ